MTGINSVQFQNIQIAVATHFQAQGIQVFITDMCREMEPDGSDIVLVDVAVLDHPEVTATVEVDVNLVVTE